MRKIIITLTTIALSFCFMLNVNAASGSITASSSTKTAVVGSTFTVTVKVSCSEALGSWQFGISYDSNYISLQSGDTNIAAYGDGSAKTKTYTYKFKAIKSGSAGVRITGASMVSWNDVNTLFTPSVSNASVTVKTQAQIEASYSKDNNLKSLKVEGYDISPAFNKNTTEYSVTVPDDVTSIKVSAQENDSKASVYGTGTIDISEGINKIEIVVTAQNGSTKKYTLTVEVKDLTPIEVTVDNSKYNVVKKANLLTAPTGYTPTSIKINDIDVPAFTSELTHFTLVGLKDADGAIKLYIYNSNENSYVEYTELRGNSLTLYPVSATETIDGFEKSTLEINGVVYDVLINSMYKNIKLVYAMNVETGRTDYYMYDEVSNSFVLYDNSIFEDYKTDSEEMKIYIFALIGVSVLMLLISLLLTRRNAKLKKILNRVVQKHEEENSALSKNDEVEDGEELLENEEVELEEKNTDDVSDTKKKKRKK